MPRSPRPSLPYLTVKDIAAEFGVSARSVWRWIDDGDLVVHRFGRAVRIAPADRDSFAARCRGVSSGGSKSHDKSIT